MPNHLRPLPKIKFRPHDVDQTLKHFKTRANGLTKTFTDVTDIHDFIKTFISLHPEFGKMIRIKGLAAQQTWFELTPIIAKSTDLSKSILPEVELTAEFGHVALRPKDALENKYYHYEISIPIPDDMLTFESEDDLLRNHVSLVDNAIKKDNDFRKSIWELKPLGIVTRMCGWEGSWIVYSSTIKDDPLIVWGTPLVDAPYRDTQPFLVIKGGEFVILEDDRDPQSTKDLDDVKNRIEKRVNGIAGLHLEKQKVITVNMEWVIAHAIISRDFSFVEMERRFGEPISTLTLQDEDLTGLPLLKSMIDISKVPTYRFTIENIRKYTICPE